MQTIPDNLTIDFKQVLNVWVTLKAVIVGAVGLYAAFGKGDGLNRLFKVVVFGVCVWLLVGCAGPDDSIISQSRTQQAQIQANAQQQQLQAQAQAAQNLLQQQQQQQQATALEQAQANAQTARDDAQRQQAEALAQQAQAQQLQAGAMNNAITALDSANERATQTVVLIIVALSIIACAAVAAWGYWKYLNAQKLQGFGVTGVPRIDYNQLSGAQLRQLAEHLGYIVSRDAEGRWAIVDRNSLKRLSKQELLLELKGEKGV